MITIISQRVDFLADRNETRDSLDQRLVSWVSGIGCTVVPVPNKLIENNLLSKWIEQIKPDSIVLSGGNNLGDYPERDKTELFLIEYALRKNLPLLGICRGMQILGRHFKSDLKNVSGHVKTRHQLEIVDQDLWPLEVNSYHDYALTICPESFTVSALSEDGVIEAIKHQSLPIEGWMWHPEREKEFSQADSLRLRRLFGIK